MNAVDTIDQEDLFFEKNNQQMPKDWLNNTACEDTCSEDDRDKNKDDDETRQEANMDSDNKDHNKDTGMLDDIHEADEEYYSQLSESYVRESERSRARDRRSMTGDSERESSDYGDEGDEGGEDEQEEMHSRFTDQEPEIEEADNDAVEEEEQKEDIQKDDEENKDENG